MDTLAAIGWRIVESIDIGPLSVSPHGLGIAIGYGIAGTLVARHAERVYGISRTHIWNMLTWAVLGVIVGARLFFIVGHLDEYLPDDPLGIFRIWEGGIVFYGGAIGGIVAAYPYARRHKINFWNAMDAAALGFPLGMIFGRIGDLIIGDHLGTPTDLPWGFRFDGPPGALPGCPAPIDSGVSCPAVGEVVHQTALYDLVNAIVVFAVVMVLARRRHSPGFMIMFTTFMYATGRLASDFARGGPFYLGLRGTQWVSVGLLVLSGWHLLRIARGRAPRGPVERTDAETQQAAASMVAEGGPAYGDDPSADAEP